MFQSFLKSNKKDLRIPSNKDSRLDRLISISVATIYIVWEIRHTKWSMYGDFTTRANKMV